MHEVVSTSASIKPFVTTRITGVELYDLTSHHDERGSLTEILRAHWISAPPVQWNMVHSAANVLRGVHGHKRHEDYLTVVTGCTYFGLHDMRPASPTFKVSEMIVLDAQSPRAIRIPPGVAHGFYFPVSSIHVYGVTHYWDGKDEFGCRFDDPVLGLNWPTQNPVLSAIDHNLGDYDGFLAALTSDDDATMNKARLKR